MEKPYVFDPHNKTVHGGKQGTREERAMEGCPNT